MRAPLAEKVTKAVVVGSNNERLLTLELARAKIHVATKNDQDLDISYHLCYVIID